MTSTLTTRLRQRLLLTGLCLALSAPLVAAERFTGQKEARFDGQNLPTLAQKTVEGGQLIVRDLDLDGLSVDLLVQRFKVFADDAVITVNGGEQLLPIPQTVYFRGTVLNDPDSMALLMVREDGTVDGFLQMQGDLFTLRREELRGGRLLTTGRKIDTAVEFADQVRNWRCGTDELITPPDLFAPLTGQNRQTSQGRQRGGQMEVGIAPQSPETTTPYTVQMGIETDFEFFQIFNNMTTATTYVSDLVAGWTTIYSRDVITSFVVQHLSLWTTAADPFSQNSTLCALYEVGNYWETNRGTVVRDLVHFMSGRAMGGGVAWLGTVCGTPFDDDSSACAGLPAMSKGGMYGMTADLAGNYTNGSPNVVWDIVATAHEVGHNLNSPHTHCYNNIPTMGTPVIDGCYNGESGNGCHAGAQVLPTGGGSIMSYCHLLPGGMSNVSLYMGRAGFYGTNSERVNDRIRAKVEAVGPACLTAGTGPTIWHEFFAVSTAETPYVGDFNGDMKTDIIVFTRNNPNAFGDVYASLSDGTKFGASTKWHDFFAINIAEEVVIGDYNGDGKDDIGTYLKTTSRQVYVATSTGTGMAEAQLWMASIGSDSGDLLFAGDMNLDNKDDLILFARSTGKVYVALSTGTSFMAATLAHDFFAVSTFERPRVGDVNGDGLIDIFTFATDSPTAFGDVYIALGDGIRFGSATKWHDHFAINPSELIRIGDYTADNKDDFFTFLPAPFHQVYTAPSMGTTMGANALHTTWSPPPGSNSKFFVGDTTGDNKDDIIWFDQDAGKVRVLVTP